MALGGGGAARVTVVGVRLGGAVFHAALIAGARPGDPAASGARRPERWGRLSTGNGVRPVETEPGTYERYPEGAAAPLRTGSVVPL